MRGRSSPEVRKNQRMAEAKAASISAVVPEFSTQWTTRVTGWPGPRRIRATVQSMLTCPAGSAETSVSITSILKNAKGMNGIGPCEGGLLSEVSVILYAKDAERMGYPGKNFSRGLKSSQKGEGGQHLCGRTGVQHAVDHQSYGIARTEEDQGHGPEQVDLPGREGGDQRQRHPIPKNAKGMNGIGPSEGVLLSEASVILYAKDAERMGYPGKNFTRGLKSSQKGGGEGGQHLCGRTGAQHAVDHQSYGIARTEEDQGHGPEQVDLPGQVGEDQRQYHADPEEREGDDLHNQKSVSAFGTRT